MPRAHMNNVTLSDRILQAAIDVRIVLGLVLFSLALLAIFAVMVPFAVVQYLLHLLLSQEATYVLRHRR